MRISILPLVLVLSSSCLHYIPPNPSVVHEPTVVHASAGKTWDSVIDALSSQNIPIRNMERVSGFIATEQMNVTNAVGKADADCGSYGDMIVYASHVNYNVVVRGDSAQSTVMVTTRWVGNLAGAGAQQDHECSTKGVWEMNFENIVKGRAEAKR